jgi:hypothetical protein
MGNIQTLVDTTLDDLGKNFQKGKLVRIFLLLLSGEIYSLF